ncbi:PREDICTED: stress-response A/B barrel domain-containing protein UP3-like [Ipomoea nil]|uniref:stress-response A/B barrel domain-containing protein UP3-like n=1 Tax=Ipomoea nil TaxID=35883 RepID=UPI0009010C65|nr:PREDICTED: stress-response A/B barrel domain-containing protein UP3-like [Ipomoea nil]
MLIAKAAAQYRSQLLSPRALSLSQAAASSAFRRCYSTAPIGMSTSQIVEHVVLFKVKPDVEAAKVNDMIGKLNGLGSLPQVAHIAAGALLRARSSSLSFTHMLHCRYRSKSDLADYSAHPDHVAVVKGYVLPICEDIMAVDWIPDCFSGPIKVPAGSAIRATFLKLKESVGENEKNEVLRVNKGIKEKFPSIEQLCVGENFSPARAKGYSIGSIAVVRGVSELETLNEAKDTVEEFLDDVLAVDFAVPAEQSANL